MIQTKEVISLISDKVQVLGAYKEAYAQILTPEALAFLLALHEKFNQTRLELLARRQLRQQALDAGHRPEFLSETKPIREDDWQVAPLPNDLLDRRVEITGPVERKMVINALNSGAKVFMADFEDSNTPNWKNIIQGQINLRDAVDGTIGFVHPITNKSYKLIDQPATLMVRPRGWHLQEKHLTYQQQPLSASLVDFGLFFFHNAAKLLKKGSGPYFYLPKLENHLEARLWNQVFVFAQDYLKLPQKSIKATVLIETIMASFEMHEILFELRDHSAGLNCGRWDYIFSFIKRLRSTPGFVLPDRAQVNMTVPFMRAYTQLVIKTCHRRGVHAIGGMAAQIPIKDDPEANERALDKVRADKRLEAANGHDGTWVAHPGLVSVAMEIFNLHMPTKNQIHIKRNEVQVASEHLLEVPSGNITEKGIRTNINVGILYLESWLKGNGAAALYHLMEDAATAEISRSQLWQWLQRGAQLQDGRSITLELYQKLLAEELDKIKQMIGPKTYSEGRFEEAIKLFHQLVTNDDFVEFLTIPAYELID